MGRKATMYLFPSILLVLTLHSAVEELHNNPYISYMLFGASGLIFAGLILLLLDYNRNRTTIGVEEWRR